MLLMGLGAVVWWFFDGIDGIEVKSCQVMLGVLCSLLFVWVDGFGGCLKAGVIGQGKGMASLD